MLEAAIGLCQGRGVMNSILTGSWRKLAHIRDHRRVVDRSDLYDKQFGKFLLF